MFYIFFINVFYNMGLGYTNDYTNRNIVLIIFGLFYFYLSFVSSQLKRSKNWQGIKCNPLEMAIRSIFDADDANSNFKKCMQYSVSNDTEEKIQQYSAKLNTKMQSNLDKLTFENMKDENATNSLLKGTETQISNLENESLDNKTTINNLKLRVQQLTDRINTSFDIFKDSSNNLLNKLEL